MNLLTIVQEAFTFNLKSVVVFIMIAVPVPKQEELNLREIQFKNHYVTIVTMTLLKFLRPILALFAIFFFLFDSLLFDSLLFTFLAFLPYLHTFSIGLERFVFWASNHKMFISRI